ncbi:helix-turn-helix transcriptional regulator [Lachnoanaerobaculum sp.]
MKTNLDKLRKLKGLTQEEFAKELKVSRQTVSEIENG